jgi:hypothetical protein
MGRKLEFPERILTPLAAGMTGAIDARGDQPRVAFIREAIEREFRRRGARAKKTGKNNSGGSIALSCPSAGTKRPNGSIKREGSRPLRSRLP